MELKKPSQLFDQEKLYSAAAADGYGAADSHNWVNYISVLCYVGIYIDQNRNNTPDWCNYCV
jgi:hypothetical protein